MKNKMVDLYNHLFLAMERLNDEDLKDPARIRQEIERAKAVAGVGKVIVDGAKAEAAYLKATGNHKGSGIIPLDEPKKEAIKIDRPPADYDNSGHLQTVKKLAS